MLEIINQNEQIFEPNLDLIDNYVHQIHRERNTYQDDNHSVENIDFAVEASNMQVHNSVDCIGGTQQIALVQVDDDDLMKSSMFLEFKAAQDIQYSVSLGQKKIETNEFSL